MYEKQKHIDSLYKELILVHGAAMDDLGNLKTHGKDRIDKAVEIFKNSYNAVFLMGGKDQSKKMKEYAVKNHGINEDRILTDSKSTYTEAELKNALNGYMKPMELNTGYSVSNYWHIPRIKLLASKIMEGYDWNFRAANDNGPEEEIEKSRMEEKLKIKGENFPSFIKHVYHKVK